MRATRLPTIVTALTIAAGFLLVGCSEVEQTLNHGGDTTCADYLKQDAHGQRVTVTKFVKQQSGRDDDPSGTAVDATMVAVRFLCSVQSNSTVPIKNANLAGILPSPQPAH